MNNNIIYEPHVAVGLEVKTKSGKIGTIVSVTNFGKLLVRFDCDLLDGELHHLEVPEFQFYNSKGSFFADCESEHDLVDFQLDNIEPHFKQFNFGKAIELLKLGYKVARTGWNGKNMYLLLVNGGCIEHSLWQCYGGGASVPMPDDFKVLNAIYMRTADGKLVPWLASQTDVLSEDWVLVE